MSDQPTEYRFNRPERDLMIDYLCKKSGLSKDQLTKRPLICTPTRGHYGAVSLWVMEFEGTPCHGAIVFDTTRYSFGAAILIVQDRVKKITGKVYETIRAFVDTHLMQHERG